MLSSGRGFASDNNATCHPEVLAAITRANRGHVVAYGDDPHTEAAQRKFREHFGENTEAFLVFNGTAANVLSLKSAMQAHHAVICTASAHIETSEAGATERFTGGKLLAIPTPDGKLTPALIALRFADPEDVHASQPRLISIAQITERGTLYSAGEVRAIAELAHARGLLLHMDGARIANAAAALGLTLRQATRDLGVDILSFGGTKNGLICGESVVFFGNGTLARDGSGPAPRDFGFTRKQGMQLASKMRFMSVQFEALLSEDLWLRNARHANEMARRLAEALGAVPEVQLSHPVAANMLFARLPFAAARALAKESFFYLMDSAPASDGRVEVRWICSFDTTNDDIEEFLGLLRRALVAARS